MSRWLLRIGYLISLNPLLSKNIAYFEAVEVIWIYSPPRLPCPPCLPFTLIHHVYLVLVHPVHFIDIALVLVHLVHLVSGSGDGGCDELSQNIMFDRLKVVLRWCIRLWPYPSCPCPSSPCPPCPPCRWVRWWWLSWAFTKYMVW